MRKAGKILIAAAAATALAACSPSLEEPTDQPAGEQNSHTPAPVSVSESAASDSADGGGHTGGGDGGATCAADDVTVDTAAGEPQVQIPRDCAAPAQVLTRDLTSGSGAAATPQSTVQLDYTVFGWSDGSVADSGTASIDLSAPAGEIEGWSQGLDGARQGGERLIVLPPDLGYSEQSGNPLAGQNLVVVAEITGIA
ncbi:FKBP-type peptidyl-prolyl cis-trans isomerase [Prauserella alba]|uniref:Peptidyl-prolyl cis-trans isomerase n=1 Tax=Prauserella alba TaxID=176898 RepID=A0ABN1V5H5_9PSEU|nr:FKBP-type peptidyl-prolyl cis-trans isomerase [Prauserella alba]MCP2180477.1 FKBP-type peptidyl-prolyl cis-trans isomerase [Prauserella alba]